MLTKYSSEYITKVTTEGEGRKTSINSSITKQTQSLFYKNVDDDQLLKRNLTKGGAVSVVMASDR